MKAANIADGGQAFPCNDAQHAHSVAAAVEDAATGTHEERERAYIKARGEAMRGMSLRDHFAGLAMQAAATNPAGADGFTFGQRAEWAYEQADAMIKARAA